MVLPALTELLKDHDKGIRLEAVRTLGGLGPDTSMAIPALRELLNHNDDDVRNTRRLALGRVRPIAEQLRTKTIAFVVMPYSLWPRPGGDTGDPGIVQTARS